MKATQPFPGIIRLHFKTQHECCEAMVRLQEFYESPYEEVRGKVVDMETLMRLYAKDHNGWTYFDDWNGFNVPGHVVDDFFEKHEHLTADEEAIRDALTVEVPLGTEQYYVIATHSEQDEVEHELAHAFWYLDPHYQARARVMVLDAEQRYPRATQALWQWLVEVGYSHGVLMDEMHAYLATTPKEWWESKELPAQDLWHAGHDLRQLFGGKHASTSKT